MVIYIEWGIKMIMGIDGGGTYTRVAITDTDGNLLSYVEYKGSATIKKDPNAIENVSIAIQEALKKAGCAPSQIMGLTAGVADIEPESDLECGRKLTDIDGLNCPKQHINDSIIANVGALLFKPGIISIGGTGTKTLGITESGQYVRNYDFNHYAPAAARMLSYDCVHKIIAGETDDTDANLITAVFKHFDVNDVSALAKLGAKGFMGNYPANVKHFGDFAPMVTKAALRGSRIAKKICCKAAADIVTSIRLVGACFESGTIPVALIGAVVNSEFIKAKLSKSLALEDNNKNYLLVEPAVPPVLGAVIMAMQLCGIEVNERVLANLYTVEVQYGS